MCTRFAECLGIKAEGGGHIRWTLPAQVAGCSHQQKPRPEARHWDAGDDGNVAWLDVGRLGGS